VCNRCITSHAQNSLNKLFKLDFGIWNKISGKVTEKIEQRRLQVNDARFQDFITMMLKVDRYTIESHGEYLNFMAEDAGIKNTGRLASLNPLKQPVDKEQKEIIERQLKLFEALTPEERVDHRYINNETKVRLSKLTGATVNQINEFLRSVDQNTAVHHWLHSRAKRNLPMPKDQAEFIEMLKEDPVNQEEIPRILPPKKPRRARAIRR
jgi:signal recognition particle GTPase